MPEQGAPGRRLSISTYLVGFGLAILLPLLAAATVVGVLLAQNERARLELLARNFAQDLSGDIGRQLETMTGMLQALAASPSLPAGDFAALREQALAVLAYRGTAIAMRDATGQQIMNSVVEWGKPLPVSLDPALRRADAEVFETGKPTVSDLYMGAVTGRPHVLVDIPVKIDGKPRYALNMAITPASLHSVLAAAQPPAGWNLSIIDGNFRVVARLQENDRFLGVTVSQNFRENAQAGREQWYGQTLDGVPVLVTTLGVPGTRWLVAVSVPRSALEAPMWRFLAGIAATSALGLLGSLWLAYAFGRRLAGPITTLAGAAGSLVRGDPPALPSSQIAEVQDIAGAMEGAAREVAASNRARDEALASLARSEGRLRATYENAGVGIAEIDFEGRFVQVNETICRITGRTRDELVGRHFVSMSATGHADEDHDHFLRQRDGLEPSYVIEKEFTRGDGVRRWVRVFSTAVMDGDRFDYAVRVVLDVTDARRAARHQTLLIAELNHRVKNNLAVVQSLVTQTLRRSRSMEDFRDALTGRILALARSHELLSDTEWRGTTLATLLRLTVEPYEAPEWRRIDFEGPETILGPRAVVSISLFLHEVASNASRYGGLSSPEGRVVVRWTVVGEAEHARLRFVWVESVVREGEANAGSGGFGMLLARLSIEQELEGRLQSTVEPNGFRLEAELPVPMLQV